MEQNRARRGSAAGAAAGPRARSHLSASPRRKGWHGWQRRRREGRPRLGASAAPRGASATRGREQPRVSPAAGPAVLPARHPSKVVSRLPGRRGPVDALRGGLSPLCSALLRSARLLAACLPASLPRSACLRGPAGWLAGWLGARCPVRLARRRPGPFASKPGSLLPAVAVALALVTVRSPPKSLAAFPAGWRLVRARSALCPPWHQPQGRCGVERSGRVRSGRVPCSSLRVRSPPRSSALCSLFSYSSRFFSPKGGWKKKKKKKSRTISVCARAWR